MAKGHKQNPPLPSKQQILEFIRDSKTPVGKREIARAFNISGADRIQLKAIMKELASDGEIERGRSRRLAPPKTLPEVCVVEITGTDTDGEVLARPIAWPDESAPPKILLAPERRGTPALGPGDRVLARLARIGRNLYEGRPIRQLAGAPKRVIGLYEIVAGVGGRLRPTDRRVKTEYRIAATDANGAVPGELVLAGVLPTHRLGLLQARVVERLGRFGDAKTISLISVHEHDIPTDFSRDAVALAEAAKPVPLGERADLRQLPLITIDGDDARDFDDAVYAAPDADPNNPGGFRLIVAIADVAHYVRPGDALDREAQRRGNSVYFPDRVVPMLPEALSNELCSLRPHQDRACLAVDMTIDRHGRKRHHRFMRGLMRSAARLTYEQVQGARDGAPDGTTGPLLDPVIAPLYGGFTALMAQRVKRGTLDLDIPERRVLIDRDGRISGIVPRVRLDSHRLIEEYMILANVAAAETLEAKHMPCMYRIHDSPDPAKFEALREFVGSLGLSLARGQVIRPATFARLLEQAARTPYASMLSDLVLRTQAQAAYSPQNIGHFGLALSRYCHFTSPIRRYADLLVHRALIASHGFGKDGLTRDDREIFSKLGEQISATERRAATAERDATDRYVAAFLADRVGEIFTGRISGVTRFGLFVTLAESGGSGIVPISSLPTDFYDHDERSHALVGRRRGRRFQLAERVAVRLTEATPITGGLVLQLIEGEDSAGDAPGPRTKPLAGRTKAAERPARAAHGRARQVKPSHRRHRARKR
ncbi:MAG: ribonuclease R [Dongiaceae bacterium]